VSHAFADIAFTAAVKAAQARDGSRAGYARAFERAGGELTHHQFGPDEAAFIAEQRSLVMASVSETGWPYVQHRGGPKGFVKVLDERRIGFADYAGNRQLISVGNVAGNDRVALLLIDYAHRVRLKILGRLALQDLAPDDALWPALVDADYAAQPQRAMVVTVEGFDWNCPQHIPVRLEAEDVQAALDARDGRIAQLEARLRQLNEARVERPPG
jgi:predicted pyridoxine 5'-phosphate oxidase superfamily flavin-nucleotide-binding protein